jgi:hypothetical protein
MHRIPIVCVLACASAAIATPAPQPPQPRWADWVGDWTGKLKWTGCTADGADAAALSVEATDGALSIDLTPAGAALAPMSPVDDGGTWLGQQADVTVRLTAGKADQLEVMVDLESGCQMRGQLARATTGIAACDRLVGWSRIEARCGKLVRPPLELASRLARQRESWARAKGPEKRKVAAQCEARATKVETELVDAGCAPNPDPEIGMRGAQCQALRQVAARFSRCTSGDPDLKARFEQGAAQLAAASQTADRTELPIVDAECRELHRQIATEARHYGCPP